VDIAILKDKNYSKLVCVKDERGELNCMCSNNVEKE